MTIFKIHVVVLLVCVSKSLQSAEYEGNSTIVPAFPAKIEAYENQDVYVQIPMDLQMESCEVKFRSSSATLWPQNIPPPLEEKVEFWGNSTVCGVRVMKLTQNDSGTWTLLAKSTSEGITESRFTLKVASFPDVHIIDEELFLESNNTILNFIPNGLNDTYYCNVRSPNSGEDMLYFSEECSKEVHSLTRAYGGEWSSRIGLKGMMEEKEYTFNIKIEEERLDSGIAVSESSSDGAQSLYCNVISASKDDIEYCLFIRPGDETTLVFSADDMTDESYSYYGSGLKNKSCGITITDPETLDYGIWKCIVKYGTVILRSSISLTKNYREIKVKEETLIKEILFGSRLEIAIDAKQAIDTCVFITPNGSVIVGESQQMKFGECFVEISSAQKEHNGTWLCQMMINKQDTTAEVSVIIQESVFVADQTTKSVETGMSTTLLCHSVPLDSSIRPSLGTCNFMRPDGFMMIMDDESTDVMGRYKFHGNGISKGECGVIITAASPEDHGIWKCIAEIEAYSPKEKQSANILLEVTESTLIIPSYVTVEQEGEVVLRLVDTFQDIVSCAVETPSGDVINLFDGDNPDVSYWGNLENGECGAKINGNKLKDITDGYKKWKLSTKTKKETGNDVSAVSWIKVIQRTHNSKRTIQKVFADEGSLVEINCGDGNEESCIIVSPGKNLQQGVIGSCKQSIQIHRTDFGVWTCYIGRNSHLLDEIKEIEILDVGKYENIGWQNSEFWSQSTDLFCEVKKPLQYCSFVSPSGEAFKVQGGQGADNYVYFGNGLLLGDCGITILRPAEELKGTWRCLFGLIKNGTVMHSSRYINIINDTDKNNVPDRTEVAVRNQNVKIQCQIPETLTYCWIQHPNGSHFPSKRDAHNGICSAEILRIDNSYEGDWQCHMGTVRDETVITVTVKVSETDLYATSKQVRNIGNTVSFSCHTVGNQRLEYCRFVRPDATGFSFTTNSVYGKYEYQGAGIEYGDCGLKMSDLSAEDYGQWICAALISGETDEVMDTIIVLKPGGMDANIVIGMTVGLVSLVGIIIIIVLYWMKKIKRKRMMSTAATVNSDSTSSSDVSLYGRSNSGSETGINH